MSNNPLTKIIVVVLLVPINIVIQFLSTILLQYLIVKEFVYKIYQSSFIYNFY